MIRVVVLLGSLALSIASYSQHFKPVRDINNPALFNTQLQYTASLLNEDKSRVRVLIYGQSISVQDWWKDVKSYFEKKYPNVEFTIINKAIGGFSSERLKLTAENDIVSFYPDLILFHDYGNEEDYEKIIRLIRSKTTADLAIQTDHMADQNQEWHDKHNNIWIPELCKKYGLALIDIRKHWKVYLSENRLQIQDLLVDGVHLNDHGNYVMAETIKAYLENLKYNGGRDDRIQRLEKDKDFSIKNGWITISVTGNRVDISSDVNAALRRVDVMIDGVSIKQSKDCYYYTRPTLDGKFLTRIGSLIALKLSQPINEEEWFLNVLSIDSIRQEIRFNLHGSKTGSDGTGISTKPFTSKSGKIVIDPEAWFIRKHDGDFSQYNWVKPGDVLQWHTKLMCSPSLVLSSSLHQTVVQGIKNTEHQLQICGPGVEHIVEILVYSPPIKE
jgi:hypothetical protein